MKKTIFFFLCGFIIASMFFIKCNKKSLSCQYYTPPNSLFFQLRKNGQVLPDSILNTIKLSYFQNGTKRYITDLAKAVDFYANKGIMTTRAIGTMGVQSYFFEYTNNLNSDTLTVNYSDETPNTNCQFILYEIKFNNLIVTADSTFGYQPVYIFNKK